MFYYLRPNNNVKRLVSRDFQHHISYAWFEHIMSLVLLQALKDSRLTIYFAKRNWSCNMVNFLNFEVNNFISNIMFHCVWPIYRQKLILLAFQHHTICVISGYNKGDACSQRWYELLANYIFVERKSKNELRSYSIKSLKYVS